MKNYFTIFTLLLGINFSAHAADTLRVVATLPSFAAIAQSVGGENVSVTSIASPRFNPHFIEPKPSDVLRVKRADLYIHSGLDLEAWGGPLVDASARPDLRKGGERQLDLSEGIQLLEIPAGQVSRAEGDIHLFGNPHYWLDPRNGIAISRTIANKLSVLDPAHKEAFQINQQVFESNLRKKMEKWSTMLAPFHGAKLVGYHNEWIYLMNFAGLKMERFLEPKPGIPPSPSHIASLIEYIKETNVKVIVQATFYSTDAAEAIADRTNAQLVIACQNVGELPEASDYIAMLDYDIKLIVEALSK